MSSPSFRFKKGSIFYDDKDASDLTERGDKTNYSAQLEPVAADPLKPSKNNLFFQDFSIRSPSPQPVTGGSPQFIPISVRSFPSARSTLPIGSPPVPPSTAIGSPPVPPSTHSTLPIGSVLPVPPSTAGSNGTAPVVVLISDPPTPTSKNSIFDQDHSLRVETSASPSSSSSTTFLHPRPSDSRSYSTNLRPSQSQVPSPLSATLITSKTPRHDHLIVSTKLIPVPLSPDVQSPMVDLLHQSGSFLSLASLFHPSCGGTSPDVAVTDPTNANDTAADSDCGNRRKTLFSLSRKTGYSRVLFSPTRKNLLGEGRYANVYRGTFEEWYIQDIVSTNKETTNGSGEVLSSRSSSLEQRRPSNFDSIRSCTCAIKYLHPGDDDAQANGLAEAYILRKISQWTNNQGHPSIIRLLGIQDEVSTLNSTEPTPIPFNSDSKTLKKTFSCTLPTQNTAQKSVLLALEFCQNGTLFDFIQRHPSQCGRQLWIQWSKQIAQAVAFLHARHPVSPKVSPEKDESDAQRIQSTADSIDAIAVIHHDIKLHNVLLDDQLNAKLADFGSASLVGLSKDDSVLPTFKDGLGRGTQAYSAPEILTPPDFSYSFAADIYALGCTIYAILTSREPFNDIRNPAYQLWCIRRGFWESGANPLLPTNARVSSPLSADAAKTPAHVSLSAPSGVLKSRMASYSTPASATTVDIVQKAVLDEVLIIFPDGDTLRSGSPTDTAAYNLIISLLKQCTAVNPHDRPSAETVVHQLQTVESILLSSSASQALSSLALKSSIPPHMKHETKAANGVDANLVGGQSSVKDVLGQPQVKRASGGRRVVYL